MTESPSKGLVLGAHRHPEASALQRRRTPEAGQGRKEPPSSLQRECSPVHSWISDSGLLDCERTSSCCFRSLVCGAGYGSSRTLTQQGNSYASQWKVLSRSIGTGGVGLSRCGGDISACLRFLCSLPCSSRSKCRGDHKTRPAHGLWVGLTRVTSRPKLPRAGAGLTAASCDVQVPDAVATRWWHLHQPASLSG